MLKKIILILFYIGSFNFQQYPAVQLIEYPSEYNYSQSYNDCGPFNTAAVVRALTHKNVSSKEFAETIEGRIQYNYTLPTGLEKQLKENGINVETHDLSDLSDENKINYLKYQLYLGKPVILLIKWEGYQHYITLFGYDSDEFYVYNSLQTIAEEPGFTIDENGQLPGNMNISKDELLKVWSEGGLMGQYKWYALINSI